MSGRGIFGVVTAVLLLANANGIGAGRQDVPRALGFVAAKGEVWVDKLPAPPGTALFAGDVITTGKASVAVMNFHSGSSATLTENGEVTLSPDASPTGMNLNRGTLAIRNTGPQPTQVNVAGASVVVQGEAGFPAICRIAQVGGTAGVRAERGQVEIHGKGRSVILAPGKYTRLEAGGPQAAGQLAGKVSNAIPEETVQRVGQTVEVALKLNDPVNWEDVVRTLRTGRVRIGLLDGSFLNVGARSIMKIAKHDAQSQQTQIELQLGRLRGEVVKISKPGGNFEVRTQTAVIGVVGTIFATEAFRHLTRVFCLDGMLSVQNINPMITGTTTLQAGQYTSVPRGAPPTGAARTSNMRFQRQLQETNAGETPSAQVAQVGQTVGTTGAQAVGNVANAATIAASGASAAASGVAVARFGDTGNILGDVNATLQDAARINQSAADSAAQAAEEANDVNAGIQTVIDQLSPSVPCGCVP